MSLPWRRVVRRVGGRLGLIWALPLTLPMLLAGLLMLPFGARIDRHGPMWVVTRFPVGPRGALALGHVVLTRLPSVDVRVPSYRSRAAAAAGVDTPWRYERVHLGRHELAHVRQSAALGLLFPLVYLLCGGISARNPFEQAADRYARSGRGWWPFSGGAARD